MSSTSSRLVSLISAATLSLGGLALSATAAPQAHALPGPPTPTAAAEAARAHPTTAWPWISTSFRHSVNGRTLSFRYADAGYQHLMKAPDGIFASTESAGYRIQFGDGQETGGDAAAFCTSKGIARFSDKAPWQKHVYAKRGTYTVTVTGFYCGTGGLRHLTKTYTVRVR